MVTPMSLFDLVEAFAAEDGCPVCVLGQRGLEQFYHTLLFERIIHPEAHESFRAGLGLCNVHAWQLARHGGALLNIAVYYRGVLDQLLDVLDGASDGPVRSGLGRMLGSSGSSSLADRLQPTDSCMACQAQDHADQLYVRVIAEHITDSRLSEAYRASHGLCLPHFRQTLAAARTPAARKLLIALQRDIWERLLADLDTFKEMHDYHHTGERMGAEGDSWLRVLRGLAGEQGAFGLDSEGG